MPTPPRGRLVLAACAQKTANASYPGDPPTDQLSVKMHARGEGGTLAQDAIRVMSRAVKTITPDVKKPCGYAVGYKCYFTVMSYIGIGGLFHVLTTAAKDPKQFAVPGMLTDAVRANIKEFPNGKYRRIKNAQDGDIATLEAHADPLLIFDLDGCAIPGWDPHNPEPGVRWWMDQMGFTDCACICQITAGQDPQPGSLANVRVYVLHADPWTNQDKRNYLKVQKQAHPDFNIDTCVWGEVQPIYIADPLVINQATPAALYNPWSHAAADPIPQRWFLFAGKVETVSPDRINPEELTRVERAALSDVEYVSEGEELALIRTADGLHQQINSAVWWMVARDGGIYSDDQLAASVLHRIDELKTTTLRSRAQSGRLSDHQVQAEVMRSIEGARSKQETILRGTPPTFPVDVELSPTVAQERLQGAIDAALDGKGHHAIEGAPGIGKTHQVLRALVDRDMRADIYAPDHDLASEMRQTIADMGGRAMVIKGRRTPIDEVTRYCAKDEAIELLDGQNARLASANNLCIRPPRGMIGASAGDKIAEAENICPHFFECKYTEQFLMPDKDTRIVIRAHAYLPTDETLLDEALNDAIGKPDAVVVDEDFTGSLYNLQKYPLKQFRQIPPVYLRKMFLDGIEAGALIPTLRSRMAELEHDLDATVAGWMEAQKNADGIRNLKNWRTLRPNQTPAQARDAAPYVMGASVWGEVINRLSESLDAGSDVCNGIWMGKSKKDKPIVNITWMETPKRLHGVPRVLLLDGTMNTTVLRRMFPRLVHHKIAVKRNAEIFQVADHQISYAWLKHNRDDRLLDVMGLCAALDAGSPTGACVPKTYRVKFQKTGARVLHYGNLRGQNRLADCETGLVVSRPQPSVEQLEAQARAVFPELPLELGKELELRPMGYRMADGQQLGVPSWLHPDPLVNELMVMIRESEMVQAVDRFRLIWNKEPKRIYLLVSQPADVTVDKLIRLDDLLGPDRLMRALWKCGGVLPLSRDWLADRLSDLFLDGKGRVTPTAAKNFVIRTLAWMNRSRRPGVQLIEYRVTGQRGGKYRKAITWSGMDEGVAESVLADLIGQKITIKEKTH